MRVGRADYLMSRYVIKKQFIMRQIHIYAAKTPLTCFSSLLFSYVLHASGLMYALMFYVTAIDGVEGQWVAQLCGCKASSPLSDCQKAEACQQLCVCVSPSLLLSVCV